MQSLQDMWDTYSLVSTALKLAAIPKDDFEQIIAECIKSGDLSERQLIQKWEERCGNN